MTRPDRPARLVGQPGGPFAALPLPAEDRHRYRQEFLADLHRWRFERDCQGQRYRECMRCGAVSGGSTPLPGGGFGGW